MLIHAIERSEIDNSHCSVLKTETNGNDLRPPCWIIKNTYFYELNVFFKVYN